MGWEVIKGQRRFKSQGWTRWWWGVGWRRLEWKNDSRELAGAPIDLWNSSIERAPKVAAR